jgi:GT2 family glycosyltransferase
MADQLRPTVSIIVVNYRTPEMTLECLRSIVRETGDASYEILLVDNASNDGVIDAVRLEMPSVRCFPLQTNVGFARANNIAAEHAKGLFLLLLNPDTVVLDRAIDKLIEFASRRPQSKIWGGLSLCGDQSIDRTSCWHRVTLWSALCRTLSVDTTFPNSRLLNVEGYGGWDRLSVREVDIICGCFMLIARDLWDRLGGFDGAFFMYGEEADFCLRAASVGARPVFTPDARIIHYGGASQQVETDKIIRGLSARAELIKRYVAPFGQRMGLFVNSLLPLVRAIGYGAAARLLRDSQKKARAETWWGVWTRRSSWRSGLDNQTAAG